jgi:4,5-DOPA dioxygenase extradiol
MNSMEEDGFTQEWRNIASTIPEPSVILCISAHWYIPSTMITAMDLPKTIHDFYGFPPELYEQQYPTSGSPELAATISSSLLEYSINLDTQWGLDHGTWSVLKKMYPEANIPTLQLSVNYSMPPQYHFELGKKLEFLRNQGVLIIGSGNLVHNLGAMTWNSPGYVYDWANLFEEKITESIFNNQKSTFIDFENLQDLGRKAHPTLDHYLPLLYSIGAGGLMNEPEVFNQKFMYGSLSMTCFKFY